MAKIENINEKDLEKEAQETAKKVKETLVKVKVPIDPLNPKDLMIPVAINGYYWNVKRGETIELPEEAVRILEEAKYI